MTIIIKCTCGHRAKVNDSLAGKRIRCRECRALIHVPDESVDDPAGDDVRPGARKRESGKSSTGYPRWPWVAGGAALTMGLTIVVIVFALKRPARPVEDERAVAAAVTSAAPGKDDIASVPAASDRDTRPTPPTTAPSSPPAGSTTKSPAPAPGPAPARPVAELPLKPEDGPIPLQAVNRIVTPIVEAIGKRKLGYFAPQHGTFSPDGKEFAGVGSDARARWSIEGGLIKGEDKRADHVYYSGDGSRVFFVNYTELTVYDRQSGGKLTTCTLGVPPAAPGERPARPKGARPARGIRAHGGAVISPDGKTAFVASVLSGAEVKRPKAKEKEKPTDFTIGVYETLRGQEVRRFQARHTAQITCLAQSADGKYLLSGSEDQTVRLWDAATGHELRVFRGHTARIVSVGWSRDGKRILTAAQEYDSAMLKQLIAQRQPTDPARKDGSTRVWDVASGEEVFRLTTKHAPGGLLSPDGRFLAQGRSVWQVGQPTPRYILPIPEVGMSWPLAFSPDGKILAATETGTYSGPGKANKAVVLFAFPEAAAAPAPPPVVAAPERPVAGELNLRPLVGHTGRIVGLRALADGKRILSASWDGTLRLWDLKEGKSLKTISAGEPLAWLANGIAGNTVAVATGVPFDKKGKREAKSATLLLVNLLSGKTTRLVKDFPLFASALALSPDGSRVATFGFEMMMWETASGRPIRRPAFTPLGEPPHSGRVEQLIFASGGKRLITAGADKLIKIWDPVALRAVQTLSGHGDGVTSLALSTDSKQLLSGSRDHTLILWDLVKGKQVRTFTGHTDEVVAARMLSDGKRIGSVSRNGEVILWNRASGEAIRRLKGPDVRFGLATLSPDGRYVIFHTEGEALQVAEIPAE